MHFSLYGTHFFASDIMNWFQTEYLSELNIWTPEFIALWLLRQYKSIENEINVSSWLILLLTGIRLIHFNSTDAYVFLFVNIFLVDIHILKEMMCYIPLSQSLSEFKH